MFGVNRDILLGKKLHNIGVGKSVHHIGNVSPALVLVGSSGARLQEVIAEAPGTGVNQLIDITLEARPKPRLATAIWDTLKELL